jgi:hypothetical protein
MHIGVSLDDGRRVLVCGGASQDMLTLTNRCFVYDPALDSWSEVAPLPSPTFFLYSNPAAPLPDGRVVVAGGSTPEDLYGTDFVPGFRGVRLVLRLADHAAVRADSANCSYGRAGSCGCVVDPGTDADDSRLWDTCPQVHRRCDCT